MDAKDGDGAEWLLGVASVMQPGVDRVGLGMADQMEDFDHPFPHRLPVERLFDGNTFMVRGFYAVQPVNRVL